MKRWVTIVGSILLASTFSKGEDGTFLFHEHGFILKDQGIVYLDANDIFISVFVNLAVPKFSFEGIDQSCHLEIVCGHNRVPNASCNEFDWSDALLANKKSLNLAKSKISKHQLLLKKPDSSRKRRGIANILGAGFGIFGAIFNGIVEARISSHLQKVEREFRDFKIRQNYITGRIITVMKEIVKVVDHRYKSLLVKMHNLEWKEALIFQYEAINEFQRVWSDSLDNAFYHIDRGSLSGKLNSLILSLEDLHHILINHPELHDTDYIVNPMFFYQTSTITLLASDFSKEESFVSLHYIIQAPIIRQSSRYSLFKVEKIPLNLNGTCFLVDSPKFVYKMKEEWKFINLNKHSCKINDLVTLCYETVPQPEKQHFRCVTDLVDCTLIPVNCLPIKFIYHYSGVLISGSGEVAYINKDPDHHKNKIVTIPFSKIGVAWIPWKNAENMCNIKI